MFNESVLGPIWRKKQKQSSSPSKPPAPPQTLPESTVQQQTNGNGTTGTSHGTKAMSAFEKMMNTFDAYKETVVVTKPLQAQSGAVNAGSFRGGGGGGVTLCGTAVGGGYWEGFGGRQNSKRWQEFVSGSMKDPHTTYTVAVSFVRTSYLFYAGLSFLAQRVAGIH